MRVYEEGGEKVIDFTTITACGECCAGCKKKLTRMIHWNPNVVEHLEGLAEAYRGGQ